MPETNETTTETTTATTPPPSGAGTSAGPEPTGTGEKPEGERSNAPAADATHGDGDAPAETTGDTFPREYVERLRSEAAGHRERAREAEAETTALRERIWALEVAATGKLVDPSDLPYDPEAEDVSAAVDDLIQRKPHLARSGASNRLPVEPGPDAPNGVSLLGMLRRNA